MVTVANQVYSWCQWTLNTLLPPAEGCYSPLIGNGVGLSNVAVIMPYFVGDTVLASSMLHNLIKYRPSGRSTQNVSVIATASHCSMLETFPGVHQVYSDPKNHQKRLELLQSLSCESVFLLRHSLPWGNVTCEAGISNRIGFNLERFGVEKSHDWGGLLTHAVSSGPFDSPVHQTRFYQAMLAQAGLPWDPMYTPRIYLSRQDKMQAQSWLKGILAPKIVLHITAGSPGKRWPMAYWAELLNLMRNQYQAQFFAVGTRHDHVQYQQLEKLSGIAIHNYCGKTTLRESAALCQQADAVITLDTGLAHLAAAVDCPRLVVIYGPTNYRQWRPLVSEKTHLEQAYLNIHCRPCITRTCYHRSCLKFLSPQRMMIHVDRAMNTNPCRQLEIA